MTPGPLPAFRDRRWLRPPSLHWGWLAVVTGAHAGLFALAGLGGPAALPPSPVEAPVMQVRLLPPPPASHADDPVAPPPLALKPARKAAVRPPSQPARQPAPATLRKGPAAALPAAPPPPRPPEPAFAPSGHAIEAPPPPPLASAPPAAADAGVARDSRQSGDPGATDGTGEVSSAPALTSASFDAAYLSNPPPQYPRASRRRGEEGRVVLRVRVLGNGSAGVIEIAESSGYPRLDDAARDAVRAWRFVPAEQGEVKVESWLKVPIVFRLEG